ncbi:MAG: hypothetical protein ILO68_07375 [Clostridia bacterium]|nr:hypothetical protein [Clostridia bacterium]
MRRRNPLTVVIIVAVILVVLTVGVMWFFFNLRLSTRDGVKFAGKYEDGKPVSGIINYPDGNSATLDAANNTIRYANGDVYVGELSGVMRHGNGKMTFAVTGDVYEGQFYEDRLTGTGTFTYANGDVYSGGLQDSMKQGFGVFTFSNGNRYEGNFDKDVKSGYGTFTWKSGAVYRGYFESDVKNGEGTFNFANGDVYEGTFRNDQRSGTGLYTWTDGTSYYGSFWNNLMDTRKLDADGQFIQKEDGSFEHGSVAYYTTVSETGKKTYTGYFEAGKIVAVYG